MFLIISPEDVLIYELNTDLLEKEITYLHELIAFASLDLVESLEWGSQVMNLKNIDKFNDYIVNCFVTSGSIT